MKRKILHISTIILISSALIFISACKKTDTTPPVVTINGSAVINKSLNSAYIEPGATANDNVDGTVVVSSDYSPTNPNLNLAGTYIIHYSALDNAGNTGTAIRTVNVSNDAQKIAGAYAVIDTITGAHQGIYSYSVVVTPSSTVNNQLFLGNFSGLGDAVTVTALVSQHTFTLAPAGQTISGMKVAAAAMGIGAIGASNNITSLGYTITYVSSSPDYGSSSWTK